MLNDRVEIELNGRVVRVPAGTSLAAALLNAGEPALRSSVSGTPRGPLCGMGACYECRVTIDGVAHRRACLEPVLAGIRVTTGE